MEENFWKKLEKPIMVIAPMSGVTDEPFRLMFLKYGKPDIFWTEFVSADGLFSRGKEYCLEILKFFPKERPIVAQIFGGDPLYFEGAAKTISELSFDGIDINMGCPDIDIEKKGGGAALIKNHDLAKKIIRAVKKGAGGIPVSIKTRIGYEKNEINDWISVLLEEGIDALTVHLRTKKEMYALPSHWELAREIVKLRDKISPKTLILGNGDIKSLSQARQLVEETGLDGVMIGRGVLGNPWFFSDKIPSVAEKLNAILEHTELFEKINKENAKRNNYLKNFDSMKKHFHAYARGFYGAKELRESLMKTKNLAEVEKVVKSFLDHNVI